jgi:hypothetical protein
MKHVKWSIVAIAATLSAAVFAQPTIDGTRDALYYNLIVEQNTQTGFGDSNLGQVDYANGSELDAAYAYVDMTARPCTCSWRATSNRTSTSWKSSSIRLPAGRTACAAITPAWILAG